MTIDPSQFAHTLYVDDMDESIRFYTRALGFTKGFIGKNVAHLSLEDQSLILHPQGILEYPAYWPGAGQAGRGIELRFVVTEDITEVHRRTDEDLGKVIIPLTDQTYGWTTFTVRDPNGYIITVGQVTRESEPRSRTGATKITDPGDGAPAPAKQTPKRAAKQIPKRATKQTPAKRSTGSATKKKAKPATRKRAKPTTRKKA